MKTDAVLRKHHGSIRAITAHNGALGWVLAGGAAGRARNVILRAGSAYEKQHDDGKPAHGQRASRKWRARKQNAITARMGFFDNMRKTHPVPDYALLNRSLWPGLHGFLEVLPRARESPAMMRICKTEEARERLLTTSRVRISLAPGYAYINTRTPCIELSWMYYAAGSNADLYMDMLHELTHLRQLSEGAELWDRRFSYVNRPTEIEGYAVAVEEGRRLGLSDAQLQRHLHNPWMTAGDVEQLKSNIQRFLAL